MFHKNFGGKKFFIKTFFREDFRGKKWDPSTINKLTKNITQVRNKKFTIIFFHSTWLPVGALMLDQET